MMSDNEEQLDDLHKSILSLCSGDTTVIHVENISSTEQKEETKYETIKRKSSELVNDEQGFTTENILGVEAKRKILTSPCKFQKSKEDCSPSKQSVLSESTYSVTDSCSDFETVDEITGSDDEVDGVSVYSPSKFNKHSHYITVDESLQGVIAPKMKSNGNMSPIHGDESRFILSAPSTPSFLDPTSHNFGTKFSGFVQSTPLQPKNLIMNDTIGTGNLSSIKEHNESAFDSSNVQKSEEFVRSGKVKKSMFQIDESDFSDMSFDDLLLDTFALCKGEDLDWKTFLEDTTKILHPKNNPPQISDVSVLENTVVERNENVNDTESKKEVDKTSKDELDDLEETKKITSETELKILDKIGTVDSMLLKMEKSQIFVNDGKQDGPSTSTNQDQTTVKTVKENQNISKIKIDSIFADGEAQTIVSKNKSHGRFSNFTSSILSDIEVTEDESEDGEGDDVLGLNNFTYNEADDIDLDDEDEATLLDETITDLPDSIRNKYKVQEQVSILKADTTVIDKNKTVVSTGTDFNKNEMKLVSTEGEKSYSVSDDLEKIEKGEKSMTVKVKEEDKATEEDEDKTTDMKKITQKIDYEAERTYFKIESPEVRDIMKLWQSQGIQDPDINLSCATNFRVKNGHQKGSLEGTHISCIWLQESVDAEKKCSSPEKKRQKLDSEAQSRQNIRKLEQELDEMNLRHEAKLQNLFQEWLIEKQRQEGRNQLMLQNLKMEQISEMKENYFRFRYTNVSLFQLNFMRLRGEHEQQKTEYRVRFHAEMDKLKHIFQRREVDIERSFNHRKEQLTSLIDQMKHVKSDGKYGPHVKAQFVKGPCRSNKLTRSLVEVYVPADVAKCILKEDEVIDSFYKYE